MFRLFLLFPLVSFHFYCLLNKYVENERNFCLDRTHSLRFNRKNILHKPLPLRINNFTNSFNPLLLFGFIRTIRREYYTSTDIIQTR